jgi:hypothetical protein
MEDLPVAGKRLPSETRIARDVEQVLAARLPRDWRLGAKRDVALGPSRVDLVIELTSPAGEAATLAIEIKRVLEPRQVPEAAEQITTLAAVARDGAVPVVAAAYLSPRARELLVDFDVGYIDTTGNARLAVSSPGFFMMTPGAERDPWPQQSDLQSLRGRGTARALRAIIDTAPPFGIRELASATGASAPTISRVIELLERDAIVTREPRGPVLAVDWEAAIRRWAQDYEQTSSNAATMYLEPRGLPALETKLAATKLTYAATGAFAAQRFDPIAPARIATLYVDDVTRAAERLDLRQTDAGANVMLLEPFDPVVFDRTIERDGLRCVAPSQLAVDLLTGPGREPSQGEEILAWMKDNEDAWRS